MTTKIIQNVTLTCDGPRCIPPVKVTFNDEDLKTDPNAMPDEFYRFLAVKPAGEDKVYEFCSRKCVTDWFLFAYVPPKSPRERLAEGQTKSRFDSQLEAEV